MTYTAADLYKNGLARFGMNFSDGLLGNDNATGVYAVLCGGIVEFYSSRDWNFLIGVGSDTVSPSIGQWVTLPSDFNKMAFVGTRNPHSSLSYVNVGSENVFGEDGNTDVARGFPRFYTVWYGQIEVFPMPQADVSIDYVYYKKIDTSTFNTTDGSSTTPITSLASTSMDSTIPTDMRPLAELYVAKHAALLIKDREVYGMIQDEIRSTHAVVDDNLRKARATNPPKTRADWYQ